MSRLPLPAAAQNAGSASRPVLSVISAYEGRLARIDQKLSALTEFISRSDPDMATALRTAWQLPARSLAFRNAEHRRKPDEPAS
jgi:hypothetical protein